MTSRTFTLLGWVLLAAAVVALEVRARVGRDRFATLGDALYLVVRARAARWLLLLGWVWLGWHLFAR